MCLLQDSRIRKVDDFCPVEFFYIKCVKDYEISHKSILHRNAVIFDNRVECAYLEKEISLNFSSLPLY